MVVPYIVSFDLLRVGASNLANPHSSGKEEECLLPFMPDVGGCHREQQRHTHAYAALRVWRCVCVHLCLSTLHTIRTLHLSYLLVLVLVLLVLVLVLILPVLILLSLSRSLSLALSFSLSLHFSFISAMLDWSVSRCLCFSIK